MKNNSHILIQWEEEKQVIDGFGVSQAGWAFNVWAHKKRDEVMGWLFGDHGLRLNMLRGQVFPHYSPAPDVYNFDVHADIDIPTDDPIYNVPKPSSPPEDLERRGQLWVTREARKTFGVEKLIFSTWTPPAYMKSNGSTKNGGSLIQGYRSKFARYLSEFCNAYDSVGLKPYAISPVNEPEFPASWNSCLWLPISWTIKPFLLKHMGPLFKKEHPDIKIYVGENGQWYFPGASLVHIGSKSYIARLLEVAPELTEYVEIAAGHGYPLPIKPFYPDPPIIPFTEAVNKGMKVWQTEISRPNDDGFLPGIENGLSWAARYHKYLCNANVNAFLWWAGAQPNYTSETLIGLNDDREGYDFTKRYETFGHYTRYIKEGSIRVEAATSELPRKVKVSAFKKGREYVMIAINPTKNIVTSQLTLENVAPLGKLQQIITDANSRWKEGAEIPLGNEGYTLEIPSMSIVTYIGQTCDCGEMENGKPARNL